MTDYPYLWETWHGRQLLLAKRKQVRSDDAKEAYKKYQADMIKAGEARAMMTKQGERYIGVRKAIRHLGLSRIQTYHRIRKYERAVKRGRIEA